MGAFIIQNGKHVTSVKAGSRVQLYANDAGFNNNPEFLVTDSQGAQVFRLRVVTGWMADVSRDWTAPSIPGGYIFYQDSADLLSPDKQVKFTVTGGSGDGGSGGGGLNLNSETIKQYAPWAVLVFALYLIVLGSTARR
jgi:hypothetical protein